MISTRSVATAVFILLSVVPMLASAQAGSSGGSVNTNNGSVGSSGSSVNTNNSGSNTTLINPLGSGATLNTLLDSILKFVIQIGAIVIVLMLVYIGFLFVQAQGEPGKISEARNALLWTVVGALILLGAVAIKDGIQATVQALSTGS